MVTVEWSANARARLQEVYDYLFDVAGDRTARKITGKIQARTEILSANPRAGQREGMFDNDDRELRYLVERNYKIVYWIESEHISIMTVFDCRQNPERMKEEVAQKY
jgi:plasmid stabilization system protein ParE